MLSRHDFLGVVLPPEGKYCVVGIAGKSGVTQRFYDTLEEVDGAVADLDAKQINSFVALASYNNDTERTAVNARCLRSFFLDLDVGPNNDKKYPDQRSAVLGLKKFIEQSNLPKPMLVNSGRGIHAYWPLTEPVTRDKWKLVAAKFKIACVTAGLKIDPSVTADAARILRAVDTSNWKDADNPLPVGVFATCEPVEFEHFRSLLGVPEFALEGATPRPLNDITKSLTETKPSSFKLILKKSMEGKGCNQILNAVQNQDTLPEPMWRMALSIAKFCKDGEKAAHYISRGHPDYTPSATENKVALIQGPYGCDKFWEENPLGCEGCAHRGKITNPLALGRGEIEVAAPEDNVIPAPTPEKPEATFTIPEYPFPFCRGKNGGIVIKAKDADDNPVDKVIYENDFYLVHTVDDPLQGMSGLFRLHLPKDGVREFMIPFKDIIAKETFGKKIAEQGISTLSKQMEPLMSYVNMSIKKYQTASKAANSRLQFGWADNYTSFIVGDRQITANGISYSPPSSVTIGMMKSYCKTGSLEEWKKLTQLYNKPGMEPYMFGLFIAFGSVLAPFIHERCGIVNYFSSKAGTGKTTILRMINSVFGHPVDTLLVKDDTMNSRINRVGVLQHIAPTIDEITNESPETVSNFLYSFLQGRGKHRLHASLNIERQNTITWNSIGVTTSNSVQSEKLFAKKNAPDGELSRLIEFELFPITNMTKEESDALFAPLHSNYGLACEPYLLYVLRNMPVVFNILKDMQQSIDRKTGFTQRERFWSSTVTCPMAGGLIAREAGVLDLSDEDIKRVFDWVCRTMRGHKQTNDRTNIYNEEILLGAFLSEHLHDTLVINSVARVGGMQEAPIVVPKNKLYVRHEPDAKLLYINRNRFREYCIERQVPFNSSLEKLKTQGVFLGECKKRMGKGLHTTQPEVALMFRYESDDLFNADT